MNIVTHKIGLKTVYMTELIRQYVLALPDGTEVEFIVSYADKPTDTDLTFEKIDVALLKQQIAADLITLIDNYTKNSLIEHMKWRISEL